MISNYKQRKKDGLVSVMKTGEDLTALIRQFDQNNGTEIKSITEQLDLVDLEREKAVREAQVAELDELIKDLERL